MFRRVFPVCLFLVVLPATAAVAGLNLSGNWQAVVHGLVIKATMNQHGDAIDGVAYVHSLGGKKDTFHFKGNVSGAKIQVAHHSGHRFSGTVTGDGRIKGVLTTKQGTKAPVELTRY